jgi:hypothetical protein
MNESLDEMPEEKPQDTRGDAQEHPKGEPTLSQSMAAAFLEGLRNGLGR